MRRILSIDGGGIKGVFPASFLTRVEENITEPIASYFDLIVGTSTGGIIALGLGLGLTAAEMLDLYEKLGSAVFKRTLRSRLKYIVSKYQQEPLREALSPTFGARKLGDSRNRLVIPSLSLGNGEVYIYKTAHHERLRNDYKTSALDVALATSAAPAYFPAFRSYYGTQLIDGGVWANNPTGLAVVEAIGVLNWPRENLRVLSLGCGTEAFNPGFLSGLSLGQLPWGLKIASVMMSGQSHSSLGTAKLLIGPDNLLRISPQLPNGRFSLDSYKGIVELKGIGAQSARNHDSIVRQRFVDPGPVESFEPIYK